jgi:exosortase/archaeosortase family protein
MSATDLSLLTAARDWRSEWHDRWQQASTATRTRIQVGVFLAVVVVAYHYSLNTLLQSLNLDTPLAYIGLVPVIALGLAAVRSRPRYQEPAIYDRQLDYIVGLPLLAVALAMNVLLPKRLSAMFWVWRIDLLSLPFFVAGVAAIIFGVRALWRQRLAVAYLFLAWPVPYSFLLLRELNTFTTLTLHALRGALHHVHVATQVPSSDGSLFNIVHHGRPFQLSVVSACAGVNGMVGFLLVGTAFGAVVTGPRLRKTLWLFGGLALLWFINLGRLLFIFWTGQEFGEHFAIKVLHPFVGLITFNIGVIIMLLLLKPVGLRIGLASKTGEPSTADRDKPADQINHSVVSRPLAVPAVYSAIALLAVVGVVVGVTNSNLRSYDLVASATGEPKLASYLAYPASPSGWSATFDTQFDWAKPYFGETSSWYRYSYTSNVGGGGDLQANLPITADVVNTSNLFSFSAYGVEACYRFHGYSLQDVAQVSLGGGITGQALSYNTKNHTDWSIVYWIWPIKNGNSTRYERVILYMLNTGGGSLRAPSVTGLTNLHGSLSPTDQAQRRLIAVRAFLVSFAREVIKGQASVAQGARLSRESPSVPPLIVNGHWNIPALHNRQTTTKGNP